MRITSTGRTWSRGQQQAALIAAVLLTLAVGLCMFHAASHEHAVHGMSPDLCAVVVMILVAPLLLAIPVVMGWLAPVLQGFFSGGSVDLPDRPPEAFSLPVVPDLPYRAFSRG
jgi:hypothetical protein